MLMLMLKKKLMVPNFSFYHRSAICRIIYHDKQQKHKWKQRRTIIWLEVKIRTANQEHETDLKLKVVKRIKLLRFSPKCHLLLIWPRRIPRSKWNKKNRPTESNLFVRTIKRKFQNHIVQIYVLFRPQIIRRNIRSLSIESWYTSGWSCLQFPIGWI